MATTISPPSQPLPSPSPSPPPSLSPPSETGRPNNNNNNNNTNTTSTPRPNRTLRILCFGDSLTSGYSQLGASSHPYSISLTRVLSSAFPRLHVEAHADGLPGDRASAGGRFLSRIEPRFLTRAGGTPYDWTVVLGGTNDLASPAQDPLGIYTALRDCWDVALSRGGRVLACTVPEAGVRGAVGERVRRRRDAVNELIRSHKQENFFVFDLAAAIPFWSLADAERERYWDDAIHLTPDGYDLMGERIAAHLVDLIMPPGRLQPQVNGHRPNKRKRVFKDDDKLFEEEVGDDNLLDQGYYVVRRKDLE